MKELLKNKKIANVVILLLIGVVAVIAGKSLFGNSDNKSPPKQEETGTAEGSARELENRLESILSTVKGAGKVSVFVVLEDYGTQDYLKDEKAVQKENQSESEEKTVLAGGSSNSEPVLSRKLTPRVKGIIVSAEGAGSEQVRETLSSAVESALGIMPHRIEIVERTH